MARNGKGGRMRRQGQNAFRRRERIQTNLIATSGQFPPLQHAQECHQVSLFRVSESHGKANVIKFDNLLQTCRRTVMKIWCPCGQPSQDRPFQLPNIRPFSGY